MTLSKRLEKLERSNPPAATEPPWAIIVTERGDPTNRVVIAPAGWKEFITLDDQGVEIRGWKEFVEAENDNPKDKSAIGRSPASPQAG